MDLFSVVVGIVCGGLLTSVYFGIYIVRVGSEAEREYDRVTGELEALKAKYEALHREYYRVTDRDSRGRFVKR